MVIEDLKSREKLVKRLRRLYPQEFAPLFHKFLIVRHDIPWAVGRMSLKQIIQRACLKILPGLRRNVQYGKAVFRFLRQ